MKSLVRKEDFGGNGDAFSLVELLVVIAIIAIVAAIAIPNIAGVSQSAGDARDLRNAQTLAVVYNAAVTAGMNTNGILTLHDALAVIVAGTNIPVGNTMHWYSADGLTQDAVSNATDYLGFRNGLILYSPHSN